MSTFGRRDALKALSAAAVTATGATLPRFSAAAETRSPIEKGAELKLLRWKRYVQGDEDLWMANTAKFNQVFEEYATRYPEQWLWVHRRWKTRPPGEPPIY